MKAKELIELIKDYPEFDIILHDDFIQDWHWKGITRKDIIWIADIWHSSELIILDVKDNEDRVVHIADYNDYNHNWQEYSHYWIQPAWTDQNWVFYNIEKWEELMKKKWYIVRHNNFNLLDN